MLQQFLLLGVVLLIFIMAVNGSMTHAAGRMAAFFARNAFWIKVQRYVMGTVFAAFACHIALKR